MMRINIRKNVGVALLLAALLLTLLQGEFTMATSKPVEGPDNITFITHCAGRYELDLPDSMRLITSGYVQPQFALNIYDPNDPDEQTGIILGEDRLQQWQDYVEQQRLKAERYSPTRYILKELEPPLKTIVFYEDSRELMRDDNTPHDFPTFFFKDFPEQQLGLTIAANLSKLIPRSERDVEGVLRQRIRQMHRAIEAVVHEPWPHRQLGVCLPRDILVGHTMPPKDDKGSYVENYRMEFYNDKHSIFEILVNTYGTDEKQALKEELDRHTGMLAFFASKKMTVAGRKGRLIISDGKYSSTEREFRWISTDTKLNSVRYAHIEISGKIEIEDYPDMHPLNATDMVVGLLKGVRVRENGMAGVKE